MSTNLFKYDITFCMHEDCYEDCEYNLVNADDEAREISISDRYGPGCMLYESRNLGGSNDSD